jgi:hypothetical protein
MLKSYIYCKLKLIITKNDTTEKSFAFHENFKTENARRAINHFSKRKVDFENWKIKFQFKF